MFRSAVLASFVWASVGLAQVNPGNTDTGKTNDPPKPPVVAPELRPIMDRLDQLERTIKRNDDEQTKSLGLWAEVFRRDINEIRDWMNRVQRDLNELRSTSRSGLTETLKPVETGRATLLLVNAHPFMNMDVLVNGVTQTVMPGQSQTVPVPAGNVNFQVMQTDAFVRARSLVAGATHVVTMR